MTTVNNLFNQLPNGFFNLLASNSNNQIYADCLELIFREYEREVSYRIPRDRIRDAIAIYIAENHIKALDDSEDAEPKENNASRREKTTGQNRSEMFKAQSKTLNTTSEMLRAQSETLNTTPKGRGKSRQQESNDQSPNDIASRIIYKFLDSNIGWLEEEIDDVTYERQIIMTEQGVLLAEFLMNLKRPEKAEFASYIFDIYNTLNNKDQWQDNPYAFALKSVYRNAKALAKSLKRLSTYMKKYIEQMVHEETLESLTNNLLEYSTGNFIHEYARLTKQSNIHLYRQSINKKLRQLRTNKELFELLVIGCFDEEELSNEGEAEEFVIDLIDNTNRFLNQDYDEILRDIKNKITLYLDIAIGRARFIQNKEADARGKVEQVLKYIATEMESLGMKEEIPEEMTSLFAMDSQEFMDLQSLRYPRKAQPIRKATVDLYEEMTEEDRERARMLQEREAYNPYARELMKQYIEQQLQGRTTMTSEELPLASRRDVLAAVSSAAYGDQNGYDIILDEEPEYEDKGDFVLRKFTIKKKG